MKKILIVEDEEIMLKALVEKFSLEGFEVVQAIDGEEGLKKALHEKPDIILLDILLPKMDGMAVLKKLREDAWGKYAKVILLTNVSDAETVALGAEFGAGEGEVYEYLVKTDWTLDEVVQKVKNRLQI